MPIASLLYIMLNADPVGVTVQVGRGEQVIPQFPDIKHLVYKCLQDVHGSDTTVN
jgi:hypothetical protein